MGHRIAALSLAPLAFALPAHTQAQSNPAPSGAEIYRQRCAMCHDNPSGSIPPAGALRTRAADYVLRVLEGGVMRPMAEGLSPAERQAVAEHVTAKKLSAATIDLNANRCAKPAGPMALNGSSWNGWAGAGVHNARFQPVPGIAAADVGRLKLKWAFALPGGTAGAQAQPTVVGNRVFLPSASGAVFALDAQSGCTLWVHDLGVPVRNAMTVAPLPKGGTALYFGDDRGDYHALDAVTGKEIWRTRVDSHPAIRLTGSAVLFGNRLYVPVSSLEEAAAGDPRYKCCTFRGSLVALDAITGKKQWQTYMLPQPARPLADDPAHFAPAGAAIWTTPVIDTKRRMVYVTTGDSYTEPAPVETNAVIAMDLATGARRWMTQVIPDDVWVANCDPKPTANCPKGELGPDHDLTGAVLTKSPAGRDLLVVSSKSGMAVALDPDARGKIAWQTRVSQGGTRGGLEWGGATDGPLLYYAISDERDNVPFSTKQSATRPVTGGVSALDVATGKLVWHRPAPVDTTCGWGMPCRRAQLSAPSVMPGAVFSGSWDGHERAYSTKNGQILWDFDTGHAFDAVNGSKATGGSMDGATQTIAGGQLYVFSGVRDRFGNALLVFSVDGK